MVILVLLLLVRCYALLTAGALIIMHDETCAVEVWSLEQDSCEKADEKTRSSRYCLCGDVTTLTCDRDEVFKGATRYLGHGPYYWKPYHNDVDESATEHNGMNEVLRLYMHVAVPLISHAQRQEGLNREFERVDVMLRSVKCSAIFHFIVASKCSSIAAQPVRV